MSKQQLCVSEVLPGAFVGVSSQTIPWEELPDPFALPILSGATGVEKVNLGKKARMWRADLPCGQPVRVKQESRLDPWWHEVWCLKLLRDYDAGFPRLLEVREDARVMVVTELPGQNTDHYRGPGVDPRTRVSILEQLALRMEEMADIGVAHADVWWDNELWDPASERLSMVDFGSSALVGDKPLVAIQGHRKNRNSRTCPGIPHHPPETVWEWELPLVDVNRFYYAVEVLAFVWGEAVVRQIAYTSELRVMVPWFVRQMISPKTPAEAGLLEALCTALDPRPDHREASIPEMLDLAKEVLMQ
ncbi:MAG TPA: hypothetical protein VMW41_02705 [Candidatus Bathyarchaeia archaeon]|nr:hypothetical protein [Candidatus Bathyarchaeia archaeon]